MKHFFSRQNTFNTFKHDATQPKGCSKMRREDHKASSPSVRATYIKFNETKV